MNTKYILLILILIGFTACNEPEDVLKDFNIETDAAPNLPELSANDVDFSNYIAVGASFTAGFTDGALFKASQENSFPNMLTSKFALVGGNSTFSQPLMNDNFGGLIVNGNPVINPLTNERLFTERLIFNGAPAPLTSVNPLASSSTDFALNNPTGPFHNLGVPGAKSFHLLANGYGNIANFPAAANPYAIRITGGSSNASILEIALSQNPTFFTLSEVGGNDVLGYALSGGDGSDPITDTATFNAAFNALVTGLTSGGAKGVVTNLPYVTDLPHFTTVPNNALELDAGTAAQLTGVFQAVSGIFLQGLLLQGIPVEQAQPLAAQYAITFNAGANRWIIDVPVTPSNPLGFRQMTEDELLVLTIDQAALAQGYGTVSLTPEVLQVLGILQAGGTPTPEQAALVLAAVNGIDDGDALDSDELAEIKRATDNYNTTIASVADSNPNVALVDLNNILGTLAATGIPYDDFTMKADLVTGGAIGLDGVHLTARGYSLMANKFLEAIDDNFGTNFKASGNLLKAVDFPTNYSPALQ